MVLGGFRSFHVLVTAQTQMVPCEQTDKEASIYY